jgi:hypothetical protein
MISSGVASFKAIARPVLAVLARGIHEAGADWRLRGAAPAILVEPTSSWPNDSRQRIAPLIENTRVLAERVSDPRGRDSGNTILAKEFPGGDARE